MPPLELGPDLKYFLWEPVATQGEDSGSNLSQESLAEDYEDWIKWKRRRVNTPNWWQELLGIPGVDNFWELTWKIRASFELPQVMSEVRDVENYYLAPPAPKYIHQNAFLLCLNLMFPCQDIREGQLQKTLAYAQDLQYWVEKSNPPMPGQPCLLGRCMIELIRVRMPYSTFSDDAVLDRAALQERSLEGQTRVTISRENQPAPTKVSTEEVAPTEEPNEEMDPQRLPPKKQPLQGSPLKHQPSQQPPSASQQKSWMFPQ